MKTHHNRIVTWELPSNLSGETVVPGGAGYIEVENKTDKPFEIARVIVKITALADGAVCDPQPSVLDRLIKIGCVDLSKNAVVASADGANPSSHCGLALRSIGNGIYEWISTTRIVMDRGEGYQFKIVPRESFVIAHQGQKRAVDALRVEITCEGAHLFLAPYVTAAASNGGVEASLG